MPPVPQLDGADPMSLPTTQQVDSWRAQVADRLHTIQTALFDLIDCGAPTPYVRARQPSVRDREATDTADGRFAPTTKSQTRRTAGTRSDPVGRAVEAWESDVQSSLTALYALVSAADLLAGHLGLTPTNEDGQATVRPRDPATRPTVSGVLRIDVDPSACRRAIVPAVVWLSAVYDQLADRMRACTDPESGEHLTGQAELVRRDLASLERRLVPQRPRVVRDHPDTVRCGCGRLAKYKRLGQCDTCRRRELRAS